MRESMIAGLAHIGIPTENLEASRKFFEFLGFATIEEFKQPDGEPVIFLQQGNTILEVYKGCAAGAAGAVDHIAFEVENIRETYRNIVESGYDALEQGIQFLDFGVRKVWYFTIAGPNMEKIEFCQPG